ncbi:hypothetical protein [Propionispora vibrioides]|jgi:hypothetical protein|uniref:Uncharacterized protein n=1 Tax=Propionispora vibrioides TaxID=112903 RepID=A0A1H8XVK9_9FIRM|nr:hypothetical protein [Propionispora vibrioides]SEP43338.1 hypothetical protein SAMN04490178_1304 [Propionispora vibrioides]
MDCKYPHWYHDEEKMEPCCDPMDTGMYDSMPGKVLSFPDAHFKDRLMCLLGDEVLFSVDARFCGRESFCGTLCYVGCDFIIVNTCFHRKSISMHIPIKMLRFIAPFKGRR